MTPDTMAALSVEAAEAAIVWLHVHREAVASTLAALVLLTIDGAIAWTLVRVNRENVCPDPYDAQDFVGCESLRALPPEQPAPRVQPWQDWADVFPRYSDGHDGPGGVVTWKRARAADTEGGEA
jgi:hypothetical protein